MGELGSVERCRALVVSALTGGEPKRVVAEFLAAIARVPVERRGRLAGAVILALGVPVPEELVAMADSDPPAVRRWGSVRAATRATLDFSRQLDSAAPDPGVLDGIVSMAATALPTDLGNLFTGMFQAQRSGDIDEWVRIVTTVSSTLEGMLGDDDHPHANAWREQLRTMTDLASAASRRDRSAMLDSVDSLRAATRDALSAATPETPATATPDETPVGQCRTLIVRALTEDDGEQVVEEFWAEISRLPADHPQRARLAAALVIACEEGGVAYLGRAAGLLKIVDADPPAAPRWPKARQGARAQAEAFEHMADPHHSPDTTARAIADLMGDRANQLSTDFGELLAAIARAQHDENLSELDRISAALPGLLDAMVGDDPRTRADRDQLLALARFVTAGSRSDPAGLRAVFDALPPMPGATALDHAINRVMDAQRSLLADGQLTDEQLTELARSAADADLPPLPRITQYQFLGIGHFARGPRHHDRAVAALRAGLELSGSAAPALRAACQATLAHVLSLRPETGEEAVARLEDARELLGGPESPLWILTTKQLADVRQQAGQDRAATELKLLAQRGYAWRALRESSVVGARDAVREAAGSAVEVARQCLRIGDVAGAVRALDSGRGLMLFAAVELPKVPDKLRAAGHDDLARRWLADGGANAETRRAALAVLPDRDRLLDPPDLDEIRAALRTVDADALVYLAPGLAVVAPVDGAPVWLELPDLDAGGVAEVRRYLDPTRDLAPATVGDLDAVGGWAWRVAVGPLLELLAVPEPRIVLVPMGDLARIPWEAARRPDGVYAIELAAFSHAVSARLLCENAALPAVAAGGGGLIVGDPETAGAAAGLAAARVEAHALRGFYPHARYVGRLPDGTTSAAGAGTAAQVRRWLAEEDPAAGGVAHLACHGRHEADQGQAYLVLAPETPGGPASRLAAEQIGTGRPIGLVVLAACHSGRSIHGFDEAYSLGTAFLAGRVRSVLSAQWAVPDRETSALMYLFHHYRVVEGRAVREALRLAQLWMLDPDRRAPAGMPDGLLASVPERNPAQVVAWAGFVHYGQ